MYFPRDISEIGDFLRSLKYNSNEENIRILDDILDRMRHMHGYTNKEVENLLFQYRMSLIRQDDNIDGEKLYRLKEEKKLSLENYYQELRFLTEKHEHYLQLIEPTADRYARTDYDIIDSVDMEINVCIENGELEKADSLLNISKKEHIVGAEIPKEDYLKKIGTIQKMLYLAIINKDDVIRNKERYQQIADLLEIVADENYIQGNKKDAKKNLEKVLEIQRIFFGEDDKKVKTLEERIKEL